MSDARAWCRSFAVMYFVTGFVGLALSDPIEMPILFIISFAMACLMVGFRKLPA